MPNQDHNPKTCEKPCMECKHPIKSKHTSQISLKQSLGRLDRTNSKPRIQHDHKCEHEHCGKPATLKAEDTILFFKITQEGELKEVVEDSEPIDGTAHFFCDDHYSR